MVRPERFELPAFWFVVRRVSVYSVQGRLLSTRVQSRNTSWTRVDSPRKTALLPGLLPTKTRGAPAVLPLRLPLSGNVYQPEPLTSHHWRLHAHMDCLHVQGV